MCNYYFNDECNDSICTVSSEKEINTVESAGEPVFRSTSRYCKVLKVIAQVVLPDKMQLSLRSRL